MSDTTTQTTIGRIVQVDPRSLELEVNVRADTRLNPEFVASIKEHGVLTPILVQRTDDTLRVRAGQRRTLAAIEAELPAIPAYVVAADPDEVRRIVEQMAENDHRTALTTAERVEAFQQLALLGLSAAQIAKRTHTQKVRVNTALTIAQSQVATKAAAKYDLTLDQAAVIAEFDGDEEAVADLTAAATEQPEQFAHIAQRLRDKRDEAQAVADLTAALIEAETPVIEQPAWDDRTIKRLRDLVTIDGDQRIPLTEETHTTCPGRAAWIQSGWDGVKAVHVCTDPKGNGHADRYPSSSTERQTGRLTDEQKAERRTIIANNKAWTSAQTVRREWLTTFATRKTAPKDAANFIAARIATGTYTLNKASEHRHRLAHVLLGLPEHVTYGAADPLTDLIETATPARAQHITLVLLLAAIEDSTSAHTWRAPRAEDRAYFAALASWGYSLSDVEQLVLAKQQ